MVHFKSDITEKMIYSSVRESTAISVMTLKDSLRASDSDSFC